jgi:outer membrane protein insertion porin family
LRFRIILLATICLLLSNDLLAQDSDSFVISDIRITGLQRIAEGTVLTFLPFEVGDRLDSRTSRLAIRELFRSGFFQDVQLGREGDMLVISLKERPAIASLSFVGNKAIETESLQAALGGIGLAEGETFDPVALGRVEQELVRQYFNQGKYGVTVDAQVTELDRNRVRLAIVIDEGKTAKIKHINVVGNTVFSDAQLTEEFESSTGGGLFSFFSSEDQYSQEKLSGDLEKLRSFYQDRGYVDFSIESTQVSISQDKRSVFITANIREGDVYTLNEVKLTGELILDEVVLRRLLQTRQGQIFSRGQMERSIDNITAVLANVGYAFANVTPLPDIQNDDRTVNLTYVVDPGKRVYVRRILFQGNTKTKDEVLRREMRQFEGAWFSQAAVDRSKLRLDRLGYFEEVNVETPAVSGSDDQVDVIVSVTERASGSISFSVGFSQVQNFIFAASVQQDNFLGSGKNVGLSLSRSSVLSSIAVNYTNPYWTDSGVSRGFFASYSEFNPGGANISVFSTDSLSAGVNFGLPLSEVDFLNTGLSFTSRDVNVGRATLERRDEFGQCFNDLDKDGICDEILFVADAPFGNSLDFDGDGVLTSSERSVSSYEITAGWSRDTTNSFLFPSRGSKQSLSLEVTGPGSTRDFYKAFYRFSTFWPVFGDFVIGSRINLAQGDSFDNFDSSRLAKPGSTQRLAGECNANDIIGIDSGLPFFEHFFGGGTRDIRGFNDNTLGPKDQFCRAVGGDFKVSGGVELSMPAPFGGGGSKIGLFTDFGNVYEDIGAFELSEIRASAGFFMTWQAPVGPITISLGKAFRDKEGDDTQTLQFSFGTIF